MSFENPTNQEPTKHEANNKKGKKNSQKPFERKFQNGAGAYSDWEKEKEAREDELRELQEKNHPQSTK